MSTGAAVLLFGATWVAFVGLVLVLVGQLRQHGRDNARLSEHLAELEAQLSALTDQLADQQPHDLSESQGAIGLSESDNSVGDVPVITRLPDSDEPDLSTARVASVALAGPLIKAAALTHGVRRALHEEQRMRISYAMRKELRQQRKLRRRRRAQRRRSVGWVP